jgi:hypothetical protein
LASGSATYGRVMAERCRICTSNDRDGLVEHFAEQLWESRRHGSPDDRDWLNAGGYWQTIYRELATTFVDAAAVPR